MRAAHLVWIGRLTFQLDVHRAVALGSQRQRRCGADGATGGARRTAFSISDDQTSAASGCGKVRVVRTSSDHASARVEPRVEGSQAIEALDQPSGARDQRKCQRDSSSTIITDMIRDAPRLAVVFRPPSLSSVRRSVRASAQTLQPREEVRLEVEVELVEQQCRHRVHPRNLGGVVVRGAVGGRARSQLSRPIPEPSGPHRNCCGAKVKVPVRSSRPHPRRIGGPQVPDAGSTIHRSAADLSRRQ